MSKDYKNRPDSEIWIAFKEGESKAICWIMQTYYTMLYRYGLKLSMGNEALTKDCIQELFIKLWNNRMQLGEVKVIKSYLLTAFRHRLLDALSVQYKHFQPISSFGEEEALGAKDITFSHEEFLIRKQEDEYTNEKLAQAMNKLTKRQREAIYLRYFENMEYSHIAEVMALKERSVYNLVHEGLNKLREEFGMLVSLLCDLLLVVVLFLLFLPL